MQRFFKIIFLPSEIIESRNDGFINGLFEMTHDIQVFIPNENVRNFALK